MSESNTSLLRLDGDATVSFSIEANVLRQAALDAALTVSAVDDAQSQEHAVAVQARLNQLLRDIERARETCKAPVLQMGRRIDNAAKQFRTELEAQLLRITRALGDFQTLEQAKVRAAEAAARLERNTLERERQEAIAQADSHDEIDRINDEFNQRAKVLSQSIPAPERAAGQIVRQDWEITSINEWVLCRARPDLVRKIEFDVIAIKEQLARGMKLPGVEAREVIKSSVRAPAQKVIEI